MDFFPTDANSSTKYYFEKSATYFDGELVPKRVHSLLPHAKLITILISPARRAYSWYQHTKAHGDVIANNYSFHQVIYFIFWVKVSFRLFFYIGYYCN